MDSVDLSVVEKTDGNLCEHQCWANAMLRFLRRFGQTLTAEEIKIYEKKVKILLDVITETDKNKAVARRTIFSLPIKACPAYNIFLSGRIQEEFFGITILLDAYRYFGEEKYYVYAVNTTDSLLKNYQKEDGRLETACGGSAEDYTTVCCAMIPLTDMANFLKDRDSRAAGKLFRRGAAHGGISVRAGAFLSHGGRAQPHGGGGNGRGLYFLYGFVVAVLLP